MGVATTVKNTIINSFLVAGVCLILLFFFGVYQQSAETTAIVGKHDKVMAEAAMAEQMNPHVVGWKYWTAKDDMRGTSAACGNLMAEDYSALLTPTLTLCRGDGGSKLAFLTGALSTVGFVSCDSRSGTVAVKVDDGPVRELACTLGERVGIDPSLFGMVKGSKKLMIEVDSSYGDRQFTFQTQGFKL